MKKIISIALIMMLVLMAFVACKEEPAHEHSWDAGKITTPATCEKAGVKTYTCECGETKTEEIPALGHKWDAGKITTPATCEAAGVKTYTCQNDNTHTKTEPVAALGHNWDAGKITTPATCEAAGVKTYTCQNDNTHTKTEPVAALGHNYSAEYDTENHKTVWTCANDASHNYSINGKILVTVGETTTGYDTLEAAFAAIEEGSTAVVVINEDVSVASTITVNNTNVIIMNRPGATVTVQDAVTTHDTDTGSTSNQVARMFQISGSSEFVVTGNTTGTLKFVGAAEGSDAHTACNRRVLFFLGTAKATMATGSVTLKDGVEVTGIYSNGGTSFGSIVRGYGNVTIEGGNYHDNYQNGNSIFCVYGTTMVTGGTFKNNSSGGSSAVIQNCGTLTVSGGLFEGNTATYAAIVGATPSTTTITGGTFKNNSGTKENVGAAIYPNSAATVYLNVSGGTFEGNTYFDIYESSKANKNFTGGSFVTNSGTYVDGVKQPE